MDGDWLDFEPLCRVLLDAGWEVQASDVLHALRHVPGGVWRLAMDRGGRVRFVQTRPLRAAEARHVTLGQRTYQVLRQEDVTLTVLTQVASATDLRRLLADLPELARPAQGKADESP